MDPRSIMLISGDSSSDKYASGLALALQKADPGLRLFGIGGDQLGAAGVEILYNTADLDNLGVFNAFRGGSVVKRIVVKANRVMEETQPRVVVQLGHAAFDYRLLEMARCKEIPAVYYCTPFNSVFGAAKPQRLRGLVNAVAAVTYQEWELWKRTGVPSVFVGHPLLDLQQRLSSAEAREALGLPRSGQAAVMVPGQREVELRASLPLLLKAAARVRRSVPDVRWILAKPPSISGDVLDRLLLRHQAAGMLVTPSVTTALAAADAAVLFGESAALEAALCGVPAVAVYRPTSAAAFLDETLERRTYLTLPNRLLQEAVVPELMYDNFSDSNTAREVSALLLNPDRARIITEGYQRLRQQLGEAGSLTRTADLILAAAAQKWPAVKEG